MVHPSRVVSGGNSINVKQEHDEVPSSAQIIGGRRTATLKTRGRMIQLKLKIIYNETQNKDDVVVLNKQYPPASDRNGSFHDHDEEFSSLADETLELYDEDGDKVDGASFSGVTKGSLLKFENNMYEVVDPTPFEKEIATRQQDLDTVYGGENNSAASKRRVSDIGGEDVLLNNTAKKRRRRGEVDDDKNDIVCQNDCDTIVTCPIYTTEPGSFLSPVRKTFPCRYYRQTFKGKKFGLQCTVIEGRMVVARNDTCSSKPAIGDILFRLKDYTLPSACVLDEVCDNMRRLLSSTAGAVELTFAESPMFWSVIEPILKKKQMEEEEKKYGDRN